LARRFEHPGIPIYKISTGSDGFLVHPDEILSALKEYEQRGGRSAARRMWERIDPASIETEIVWWDRWVAFMQIAAQLDGFRVR
jgi:NAD kinase